MVVMALTACIYVTVITVQLVRRLMAHVSANLVGGERSANDFAMKGLMEKTAQRNVRALMVLRAIHLMGSVYVP